MPAPLLISVGEASGDRQAVAVVAALAREHRIIGKAGSELVAAGVEAVVGLEGHFGFSRPVASLRELSAGRKALLAAVAEHGVKRALLVDYSGFHIPLGRALRRRGVRVVGFIPPKLWAWGGWRLAKAKQAYDEVFTILPFEADWWAQRGVKAAYAGNPIAAQTPAAVSDPSGPVALVPGSRRDELNHVAPLLAAAARRIAVADEATHFVVPVAPTLDREALLAAFAGLPVRFVDSMVEAVSGASCALVCNGTAGLEVGLVGTPQVITYRTGALHWALGRTLVRLDVVSPNNLVLSRGGYGAVWPEIFQSEATPQRLADEVQRLRTPGTERTAQIRASSVLRRLLAGGVGIEAVAQAWAP